MAQRISINKAPFEIRMIIGDNDLVVFEFQDFWETVKKETNVSIDTYSGLGIKTKTNRKLALLLTKQLYKIEEEFPESKYSIYDSNKKISKTVVIRFFRKLLDILDEAHSQNVLVSIDGE